MKSATNKNLRHTTQYLLYGFHAVRDVPKDNLEQHDKRISNPK